MNQLMMDENQVRKELSQGDGAMLEKLVSIHKELLEEGTHELVVLSLQKPVVGAYTLLEESMMSRKHHSNILMELKLEREVLDPFLRYVDFCVRPCHFSDEYEDIRLGVRCLVVQKTSKV